MFSDFVYAKYISKFRLLKAVVTLGYVSTLVVMV